MALTPQSRVLTNYRSNEELSSEQLERCNAIGPLVKTLMMNKMAKTHPFDFDSELETFECGASMGINHERVEAARNQEMEANRKVREKESVAKRQRLAQKHEALPDWSTSWSPYQNSTASSPYPIGRRRRRCNRLVDVVTVPDRSSSTSPYPIGRRRRHRT